MFIRRGIAGLQDMGCCLAFPRCCGSPDPNKDIIIITPLIYAQAPHSRIGISGPVGTCAKCSFLRFESAVLAMSSVLFSVIFNVFTLFFFLCRRACLCASLGESAHGRFYRGRDTLDNLRRPNEPDALARGAGKSLKLDDTPKVVN